MKQKERDFIHNLCPLSCLDVLKSFRLYDQLKAELMQEDGNEALVQTMAEYAVLGYLSLKKNGKPMFCSPKALLQEITIDELADLYELYCTTFLEFGGDGSKDEII